MTGIALGCVGHLCPSWGLGHSDEKGRGYCGHCLRGHQECGGGTQLGQGTIWSSGIQQCGSLPLSELAYLFFW